MSIENEKRKTYQKGISVAIVNVDPTMTQALQSFHDGDVNLNGLGVEDDADDEHMPDLGQGNGAEKAATKQKPTAR